MNKTQNYQLNQWAKSDRVLMEDFNADNAKIDTALKASADAIAAEKTAREQAVSSEVSARKSAVSALEDKATLHTIKTTYLPRSTGPVTVSLSGIDWTQWKIAAVYIHAEMDSGTCRICSWGGVDDTSTITYSNDFVALLFPLHRNDLPFTGIMLADTGKVFSFGVSYQTAQGFSLSPLSSQTLLRGSATVYGMK